MHKRMRTAVVLIPVALGLGGTPAFASDAPAIQFSKESSSIGCKSWQNQPHFWVQNNTSTKRFEVYYDAQGGGIDEQAYDDTTWHYRNAAYVKHGQQVESILGRGKTVVINIKVVMAKKPYYGKLTFTRTSKKC